MNDIKIFKNEKFGIRTAGTSEEPLFCAIDICRALQYTNNRRAIALHVEKEDVTKCYAPTNNGKQELTFVTESGLYSLILGCKLPNAKIFKHWITSEVLPSIRRTGQYSIASCHAASYQIEDPIKRAEKWIEEEKERQRLLLENQQKEQLLIEQEPKVNFADAMTASSTSCLVGELAIKSLLKMVMR